jgi:uncharacterized membrane protein
MFKHLVKKECEVCHQMKLLSDCSAAISIPSYLQDLIRQNVPSWSEDSVICLRDLNMFRGKYIYKILEEEKGQLSEIEKEVVNSLVEQDVSAKNFNVEFDSDKSLGDKLADMVADFGGSWTFIIIFFLLLISWIAYNISLDKESFDPYPFILLNLILSCLAAIQAPIIMMSQNRQEDKDRLRAELDYKINLRAELEIRHLKAKLDELSHNQWEHLLQIQQLQTDLMQEILKRDGKY